MTQPITVHMFVLVSRRAVGLIVRVAGALAEQPP